MPFAIQPFKKELKKIFQVPECSTSRLLELRIALTDFETRNRLDNKIESLEIELQKATDEFLKIKQDINEQLEQKGNLENKMLKKLNDAKYFNNTMDYQKLDRIKLACKELENKKTRLEELQRSLDFYNFDPTNEALEAKIEELKNKRISLSELTFVDLQSNSPS